MLVTHKITLNEKARRVTQEGRDFLVAPVVAAVGGVMNGEWARAEAFKETIEAWEGIPITVNHPEDAEGPISAFSEGVQHVGFLTSPSVNGKFKAEAWFEVEALQNAGEEGRQVLTNLEAGEMMEVSTGYFRDLEKKKGIYQNRVYFAVQHNIRPDHLAVLPNATGACSIQDGCGLPRANKEANVPVRTIVINEELSLDEQMSRVYDAWYAYVKTAPPVPAKAEGMLWVREIFDNHVIVSGHPDGLLSYPYTVNAEANIEFGEPMRVEIIYQPVEMAANQSALTWLQKIWSKVDRLGKGATGDNRSEVMDRDETIKTILANNSNKFSKTALQQLGDPELEQVAAGLATHEETPEPTPVPATDPAITALTAAVEALTAKVDGLSTNQANNEKAEKDKLVAELVANEACPLPEDVLQAMDLPALQKTAVAYQPVDYSGRGMIRFNQQRGVASVEAPIMALNGKGE